MMSEERGGRVKRKLAAILAADVVGYSRLMGADEEGTHRRITGLFSDMVEPMIQEHGGRLINTAGDGLLAEFPSAVDALRGAIDLQRRLREQNAVLTAEQRIDLRIGINVGDIIADRDDIYGAGVNIAARLEQICEPGGVCVSGRVYEDVEGKLDCAFHDLGDRSLKNIERPVRVYSLASNAIGPSVAVAEKAKPSVDQPSVAVLPFDCLSEDRELKFLTQALTEDLITLLARIPGFMVIARQSSFVYQGRSVDCRQIVRELGVRYLVEGSLRPVGEQLRVGTQLIDATTGAHLWAGRFDGQAANVLDLQDQIARAIASQIEPELVRAEIAMLRRRRDANPSAWACYREGTGVISLEGWNEETLTRATALLRQATALDPDFALAHAQLALFLSLGARHSLMADPAAAVMEARAEAERAVTIDHDTSEVLGYAGCALAELGDVQRGSEILERAIENDPSNAQAWVALGTSQCFLEDRGEVGLEKLRHGMRLSPRDHRLGFWGTFYALALARHGRLAEAHEEVRAACRRDPRFYVARVVSALMAANLGKGEEATAALREARRLRPRLSLEEIQLLVGRRPAALLAPLWSELSKSS
jgi:adenylate cyclase